MAQVPFFIQDYTPREERVPAEKSHPNGVTGIASITVATDDVKRIRGWWSPALRQPGTDIQRPEIDAAGIRFMSGAHVLDFIAPIDASSPISRDVSFNHLIYQQQDFARDCQAQFFCRFQVDKKFELCRLLDGQIRGVSTFEDLANVVSAAPV